jgi:hypothetical protein
MVNRLTQGKALVGGLVSEEGVEAADLTASDDLTVADDATITGDLVAGTLAVGSSGSTVKKIATGTGSVDLAAIAAGATGSGTFTVTGAASGDVVVVNPPALTTGLVFAGAAVTGANTVTVYAVNATGSPIDEAAATFRYLWFDLT